MKTAVIATDKGHSEHDFGVCLKWDTPQSVEEFIAFCGEREAVAHNKENGYMPLYQLSGFFFEGKVIMTIDMIGNLDCSKGVYIIDDNWNIIDKKLNISATNVDLHYIA